MPIEVRSVSYVYMQDTPFESRALDGVSLSIQEGDFFLIVGSTGSGKSTLLQHLNALLLPTSGRVIVDGIDTGVKESRHKIRKKVGMVFQYPEDQFFEDSIYNEIAFGPKNMGVEIEEISAIVRWSCEMVGIDYDRLKDAYPFDLSGGERRKIAIASILAMKPSYLALDEPLAGLDPVSRRELLVRLRNIRKSGTTVIIVTHDIGEVVAEANKMVVLSRGRVVAHGTPHQVFMEFYDRGISFGIDFPMTLKIADAIKKRCKVEVPFPVFDLHELAVEIAEVIR
ncbi:MAG: energy-coupling factor transporter ATPase [Synergistetes bacterium]|nr:energy-coupling factor transporter ATPase [Synergistota bacterium]